MEAVSDLTEDAQIELLELHEHEEEYRKTHQLFYFIPYEKQKDFINAGKDYAERCFMAGNQLGKSFTGGAEVTFHLTGRYLGAKGYPKDRAFNENWGGRFLKSFASFG